MDDDSHLRPGWLPALRGFIQQNHPFDAAGSICVMHYEAYQEALWQRPWYQEENDLAQKPLVTFPTGGLYLARTAFLRQHNFPDRGLVKRHEDALLGDLIALVGGILIPFSEQVWRYIAINDGERRGNGEGDDSWRAGENSHHATLGVIKTGDSAGKQRRQALFRGRQCL
jgi:hypothetical protein